MIVEMENHKFEVTHLKRVNTPKKSLIQLHLVTLLSYNFLGIVLLLV